MAAVPLKVVDVNSIDYIIQQAREDLARNERVYRRSLGQSRRKLIKDYVNNLERYLASRGVAVPNAYRGAAEAESGAYTPGASVAANMVAGESTPSTYSPTNRVEPVPLNVAASRAVGQASRSAMASVRDPPVVRVDPLTSSVPSTDVHPFLPSPATDPNAIANIAAATGGGGGIGGGDYEVNDRPNWRALDPSPIPPRSVLTTNAPQAGCNDSPSRLSVGYMCQSANAESPLVAVAPLSQHSTPSSTHLQLPITAGATSSTSARAAQSSRAQSPADRQRQWNTDVFGPFYNSITDTPSISTGGAALPRAIAAAAAAAAVATSAGRNSGTTSQRASPPTPNIPAWPDVPLLARQPDSTERLGSAGALPSAETTAMTMTGNSILTASGPSTSMVVAAMSFPSRVDASMPLSEKRESQSTLASSSTPLTRGSGGENLLLGAPVYAGSSGGMGSPYTSPSPLQQLHLQQQPEELPDVESNVRDQGGSLSGLSQQSHASRLLMREASHGHAATAVSNAAGIGLPSVLTVTTPDAAALIGPPFPSANAPGSTVSTAVSEAAAATTPARGPSAGDDGCEKRREGAGGQRADASAGALAPSSRPATTGDRSPPTDSQPHSAGGIGGGGGGAWADAPVQRAGSYPTQARAGEDGDGQQRAQLAKDAIVSRMRNLTAAAATATATAVRAPLSASTPPPRGVVGSVPSGPASAPAAALPASRCAPPLSRATAADSALENSSSATDGQSFTFQPFLPASVPLAVLHPTPTPPASARPRSEPFARAAVSNGAPSSPSPPPVSAHGDRAYQYVPPAVRFTGGHTALRADGTPFRQPTSVAGEEASVFAGSQEPLPAVVRGLAWVPRASASAPASPPAAFAVAGLSDGAAATEREGQQQQVRVRVLERCKALNQRIP